MKIGKKYMSLFFAFACLLGTAGCSKDSSDNILETPPETEPTSDGGPIRYEIKNENGHYRLYRNNKVFYIKGAAYNDFVEQVDDFGGNAIRTYSVDDTVATRKLLDDALNNKLAVMLGVWINRPKDGFDYTNDVEVEKQYRKVEKWVEQFKNHPAVMMWSLGNEISSNDPFVWQNINKIGEMIKKNDPFHPVNTVLPGTRQDIIEVIMKNCPSFDLLGINSYEGPVSLIQEKLKEVGWNKPYMVTEFGHRGTWDNQVDVTSWGSTAGNGLIELTSTQKAQKYKQIMEEQILTYYNYPISCLGSFVFLWGYQTRGDVITWYPMFNRFGKAMEAAHTMRFLWTSYQSDNKPPQIKSNKDLKIDEKTVYDNLIIPSNKMYNASITVSDPEGDQLTFEWIVTREGISFSKNDNTFDGSLPLATGVTINPNNESATFSVSNAGFYRLNCFVYDTHNNVAHASFPFKVN